MHLKVSASVLALAVLSCVSTAATQQLDDPQLVLKAHKCEVVWSVEWNRHDTNFQKSTESNEVSAAVASSGLYRRYTETSAAHADLIFSIDDDAFTNTVTLKVLNPDDNSAVYFESRDRVALDNDVKRLIEHFLKAVDDARDAQASTATTPSSTQRSYDGACETEAPASTATTGGHVQTALPNARRASCTHLPLSPKRASGKALAFRRL